MGGLHRCLVLCLLALLAVSIAPAAVADPADAEARPSAVVHVSGPDEVVVAAPGETLFQLQVSARLECARGFAPPRDLVIQPAEKAEGPGPLRIDPGSIEVAWRPAPGEPDVYVVNALVAFNVTAEVVPEVPTEAKTVMLVRQANEAQPRLHCQVEGYDLEFEEHAISFVVVPDEDPSDADLRRADGPPIRWVPMSLAIAILGALTLFATMRERARRKS